MKGIYTVFEETLESHIKSEMDSDFDWIAAVSNPLRGDPGESDSTCEIFWEKSKSTDVQIVNGTVHETKIAIIGVLFTINGSAEDSKELRARAFELLDKIHSNMIGKVFDFSGLDKVSAVWPCLPTDEENEQFIWISEYRVGIVTWFEIQFERIV